jgi:hypothetical protein
LKISILFFGLFLSTAALADSASIVLLKGTATFGGKPITETSVLKGKGEIAVADKSYLKIKFQESETQVVIGANTVSSVDFTVASEKQEVNLMRGVARWITGPKKGLGIKTSNAIMGVRGTDFLTTYNPLLGETEVICFDGLIQMTNSLETSDSKLVSKNQWGGIGGRFGKKLSEILSLSPELISTFDQSLPK